MNDKRSYRLQSDVFLPRAADDQSNCLWHYLMGRRIDGCLVAEGILQSLASVISLGRNRCRRCDSFAHWSGGNTHSLTASPDVTVCWSTFP
jgi:hypothetical protein